MAAELPLIAGLELGGTKCVAILARGREVIAQKRFPTETPAITLPALSAQITAWAKSSGQIAALGIASFGPLVLDASHENYGFIADTVKPGWSHTDLLGHFRRQFDMPIGLDTDVAGAALAEMRWGAAIGCADLVYLTIGTGVGGGVIAGGKPVQGWMHPEIGHMRVRRSSSDNFTGVCAFHGDCLEGLISGPAITARTGQPAETLAADHPVWIDVARELSEAIAILILTLSPKRILLGGSVALGNAHLLPAIRIRATELLAGYIAGLGKEEMRSVVAIAGLAELAGPLGAIAIGNDALIADIA